MTDLTQISDIKTIDEMISALVETFNTELPISITYKYVLRAKLKQVAKQLDCVDVYNDTLRSLEREYQNCNYQNEILQNCELDKHGKPLCTADNIATILRLDPKFASLRTNALSSHYEYTDEDGVTRLWSDAKDADARTYLEKNYGVWNAKKYEDALRCVFEERKYHPIKQIIEKIEWDGVSRIPALLSTWMGVEDNDYTREVSRLIFAGGIHRLYHPGCKFEDMPVLIGKQGGGKSSFVRFLAIEDRFFTELRTIEGKEGLEAIEGAWIVEVSELLALTKTKEQEAVKAYLSTLTDKYRPAYGRHAVERPRTCTFIGTTNRNQFITDKTGGRRFYPIECGVTGYELFDREKECREYIKQCWAEAYVKRNTDFMSPYAKREIKALMEEAQQNATEDDIRVGLIQAYLDKYEGAYVCTGMLWECALGNTYIQPTRADQTQIGLIMQNMPGWARCNYKRNFGKYGLQRHWKRNACMINDKLTYNTPNDFTPY